MSRTSIDLGGSIESDNRSSSLFTIVQLREPMVFVILTCESNTGTQVPVTTILQREDYVSYYLSIDPWRSRRGGHKGGRKTEETKEKNE